MTFDTRLKAALAILDRTSIQPIVYAPPIHRLLWRASVRVRPPHFSGALANFFWLWLVFMAFPVVLYPLATSGRSLVDILGGCLIPCLSLAGMAASAYRKSAKLQGLPAWEDVEAPDQPLHPPPPPSTHWLRDG